MANPIDDILGGSQDGSSNPIDDVLGNPVQAKQNVQKAKAQAAISENLAATPNNILNQIPANLLQGVSKAATGIKNLLARTHDQPWNVRDILMPNAGEPNAVEGATQDVGEYAPAAAVSEIAAPVAAIGEGAEALTGLAGAAQDAANPLAKLAAQQVSNKAAAEGAMYGAYTNPDHPIQGASVGAGLGKLAGKTGDIANSVINKGAKGLAGLAATPLTDEATQMVTKTDPQDAAIQGAQGLQDRYQQLKKQTGDLYDAAEQKAGNADQASSGFDNSDYVSTLQQHLQGLQQAAAIGDAHAKANQPAIDAVTNLLNHAPTSYAEAMEQRKEINLLPKNYLDATQQKDALVNNASNVARQALIGQVSKNAAKETAPAAQDFAQTWANANASSAQQNAMKNIPALGGDLQKSKKLAKYLSGSEGDAAIIQQFLPKPKETGTSKMEYLAQSLGDHDLAKTALKGAFLQKATTNGIVDGTKLLKNYSGLSGDQQSWMFHPEEKQLLDSALNATNMSQPTKTQKVMAALIPSALGALTGYHAGGVGGALGGSVVAPWASHRLQNAAGQYFATPEKIAMLQRLTQGNLVPQGATRVANYPLQLAGSGTVGMANNFLNK